MAKRTIWERLFCYCPYCDRWFQRGVKRRRQSTAYEDDESNYVTVCAVCFEEIEENWAAMWDEYWASRL